MSLVLGLVLAQVLSTSPTPIGVVKAGTGATRTLADVAAERRAGIKGVKGGAVSLASVGADPSPLAAPALGPAPVALAPKPTVAIEPWTDAVAYDESWRTRRQVTQADIDTAQAALTRAESAMPRAMFSGRGSSAAQALADETRAGALLPYREKVSEAGAKLDKLREDAAKAGVPGLVR